jgi:hypothetical protein
MCCCLEPVSCTEILFSCMTVYVKDVLAVFKFPRKPTSAKKVVRGFFVCDIAGFVISLFTVSVTLSVFLSVSLPLFLSMSLFLTLTLSLPLTLP